MREIAAFVLWVAVAGFLRADPAAVLVPKGARWKFFDRGSAPAENWRQAGFDDKAWGEGAAVLGFGGRHSTLLDGGKDPKRRPISYYFRHEFEAGSDVVGKPLRVRLLRDDGAVIYLNGKEVMRSNMPASAVGDGTLASTTVSGAGETLYVTEQLRAAELQAGRNVLAVEVHQSGPASSDIAFDLELAVAAPGGTVITRGPYLQMAAPNTMTLRWRTGLADVGVVRYGLAPDRLDREVRESTATTEHEVVLGGLQAATTYHYAVGGTTGLLAGGADRFTTSPPAGSASPARVWVLGDAGTRTPVQAAVRNAFYRHAGNHLPDLCLLLGDNAYDRGTDEEYQHAVFEIYPAMLRRVPFWSCLGNHDTAQSVAHVDKYAYFKLFSLPIKGECGGVPSGREHYYSFDRGEVHFIALDSMTASRAPDGPMARWVAADLAATKARWVIVIFHHPPYSKGSHNSDTELPLVEMRRNLLPVLERGGVDVVLSGHSHAYERSYLLDGHYSLSNTLKPEMKKDGGTGDPASPYRKPAGRQGHAGTVYCVTGSAGQISGGPLNHPAMCRNLNVAGSLVLDIDSTALKAVFLDADGKVRDAWSIVKPK